MSYEALILRGKSLRQIWYMGYTIISVIMVFIFGFLLLLSMTDIESVLSGDAGIGELIFPVLWTAGEITALICAVRSMIKWRQSTEKLLTKHCDRLDLFRDVAEMYVRNGQLMPSIRRETVVLADDGYIFSFFEGKVFRVDEITMVRRKKTNQDGILYRIVVYTSVGKVTAGSYGELKEYKEAAKMFKDYLRQYGCDLGNRL